MYIFLHILLPHFNTKLIWVLYWVILQSLVFSMFVSKLWSGTSLSFCVFTYITIKFRLYFFSTCTNIFKFYKFLIAYIISVFVYSILCYYIVSISNIYICCVRWQLLVTFVFLDYFLEDFRLIYFEKELWVFWN